MHERKKLMMPLLFSILIIAGMFIGAKLTPVNRMFSGSMSASIYNYNKIQDIIYLLEKEYVDPVDQNGLVDMAIQGMLQQLDPHSVYITAEQMASVNEEITGNFEGIGVQFNLHHDTVMVLNVIRGGPAEQGGLTGGDRIIAVDGENIAGTGITNEEVMKRLKGPRGSTVEVEVLRPERSDKIRVSLVRDVIRTNSIAAAYMLNKTDAFIRINSFSEKTYREFMEAMERLSEEGMKKVVLDLRGNGGGLFDQAILIANEFLSQGELIVYTMGKSGKKKINKANGRGNFMNTKLVVLIDDFSASASEIIAGAIQDQDRGVVVGRRSFGKGLVQQQIILADGSALRVTTERYYTPSGRSIQKPYTHDQAEYYNELMERYMNGSMQAPENNVMADSLKYQTLKKGRTVYGGGGIMPDHFIPFHHKDDTELLRRLNREGLIFEFASDYADRMRTEITGRYDTLGFIKNYTPDLSAMKTFWSMVADRGITSRERSAVSDARIAMLIKAYIARNIYGEEPYYRVINQTDEAVQKAIKSPAKP